MTTVSNNGITVNYTVSNPGNSGYTFVTIGVVTVGTLSTRKTKRFRLRVNGKTIGDVTAKSTSAANMSKAAKNFKTVVEKNALKMNPIKIARSKKVASGSISLEAGASTGAMETFDISMLPYYTISYSTSDGKIDPAKYPDQHKWYGESVKLHSAIPPSRFAGTLSAKTLEVETFWHWNTISAGTGASYSPGQVYSANANATLYAQWYKASDIYSATKSSGYDISNATNGVTISALIIDPVNINNVIGSLKNIVSDSVSISENYNSDSRIQGKLTTITKPDESDGYISYGRIRIILSIPSRQWSATILTGYVSDVEEHVESGYLQRSYSIEGTLWGLLDHKLYQPVVIGKGAELTTVWTALMRKHTKMQYDTSKARKYTFSNTVLYEAGTSLSTILFEVSSGYNRMDVDPFGAVTLKRYISPSNQTASKTLNYTDLSGFAIAPITRKFSEYEAPGRAIVTTMVSVKKGKSTSQKTLVGHYDAPANDITSIQKRGWLSARTDSYYGTSENPTVSELNKVAKQNWENSKQDIGCEWSGSTVFQDYHAGDVVTLIAPISSTSHPTKHKVLISSVSTSFRDFKQSLTMKEV